jgi:hypothetical protein
VPYDRFIRLTEPVDLYLPLALDDPAQTRRFRSLRLIGWLRSGVALAPAQSQMDVIARRLESAYPEKETWRLRLVPLGERIIGAVGGRSARRPPRRSQDLCTRRSIVSGRPASGGTRFSRASLRVRLD